MMIEEVRVYSQQLSEAVFDKPGELVHWMGAVQAQHYQMAKWAVGLRLKSATLQTVEEALRRGEILRTHVMRPTWHFVAAEDIRWMLKLSFSRIKSANESFAKSKNLGITEKSYFRCNRLFERILEGNRSLTKEEIATELMKAGLVVDFARLTHYLTRAEAEGIVCSGVDKDKKSTYALLEERVPPVKELHREEALAKLAVSYFRSHSPASLQDFVWWSGLSIGDARHAMDLIRSELTSDRFASSRLFVHSSCDKNMNIDRILHFLPAFDEYLISYKERETILNREYYFKAFNRWGTFYPVILYNGKIVGNWNKVASRGQVSVETSFFERMELDCGLLKAAEKRYKEFIMT